ncbi:MAG: hypothetical protein KY468_00400 [Armatimonadetes bacterium]|nr:hypothetical protein [Armatimonadota bacterium]
MDEYGSPFMAEKKEHSVSHPFYHSFLRVGREGVVGNAALIGGQLHRHESLPIKLNAGESAVILYARFHLHDPSKWIK